MSTAVLTLRTLSSGNKKKTLLAFFFTVLVIAIPASAQRAMDNFLLPAEGFVYPPTNYAELPRAIETMKARLEEIQCGGWAPTTSVGRVLGQGYISKVTGVPGREGEPLGNSGSGMAKRKDAAADYLFPATTKGLVTACRDGIDKKLQVKIYKEGDPPVDANGTPSRNQTITTPYPLFRDPHACLWRGKDDPLDPPITEARCVEFNNFLNMGQFQFPDCKKVERINGRWTCTIRSQRWVCSDAWIDDLSKPNSKPCTGAACRCPGPGCEPAPGGTVYRSYFRKYKATTNRLKLEEAPRDVLTQVTADVQCYGFYREIDTKVISTRPNFDQRCVIGNIQTAGGAFTSKNLKKDTQKGKGKFKADQPPPDSLSPVRPLDPTNTWFTQVMGAFSFLKPQTKLTDGLLAPEKAKVISSVQWTVDQPFTIESTMRAVDDSVSVERGSYRPFTAWWQKFETDAQRIFTPPVVRLRLPATWNKSLKTLEPLKVANDETRDRRNEPIEIQLQAREDMPGIIANYLKQSLLLDVREEPVPVVVPMGSPVEFRAKAQQWEEWRENWQRENPDETVPTEVDALIKKLESYAHQIESVRQLRAQLPGVLALLLQKQDSFLVGINEWALKNEEALRSYVKHAQVRMQLRNDWQEIARTMQKAADNSNFPWCKNDRYTTPIYSLLDPWMPGRPDLFGGVPTCGLASPGGGSRGEAFLDGSGPWEDITNPAEDKAVFDRSSSISVNAPWFESEPLLVNPPCPAGTEEYHGRCFTPPKWDSLVQRATQGGKKVFLLTAGVPIHEQSPDCVLPVENKAGCAPKDASAYGRYVGYLLHHYRTLSPLPDIVVHNEVNSSLWFNVGCNGNLCDEATWIRTYQASLAAAVAAVRTEVADAGRRPRVRIPLTNRFLAPLHNPAGGIIAGERMLSGLEAAISSGQWHEVGLAYHAYPTDNTSRPEPFVTTDNIGLLFDWARTHMLNAKWVMTDVALTEEGSNSNTQGGEAFQAFQVCNMMQNAIGTPGIGSLQYHRFRDNPAELAGGYALGLVYPNGRAKAAWAKWNDAPANWQCGFSGDPTTAILWTYKKTGAGPGPAYMSGTRSPGVGYTAVTVTGNAPVAWRVRRGEGDGMVMLWECDQGAGQSTFLSPQCNGATRGPIGAVSRTEDAGVFDSEVVPIYRCRTGNDYFVTADSTCASIRSTPKGASVPVAGNSPVLLGYALAIADILAPKPALPLLCIPQTEQELVYDLSQMKISTGAIVLPVLKPVQVRFEVPLPPATHQDIDYLEKLRLPDLPAPPDIVPETNVSIPPAVVLKVPKTLPDPVTAFMPQIEDALRKARNVVTGMEKSYSDFWRSLDYLDPNDTLPMEERIPKCGDVKMGQLDCCAWGDAQHRCAHVESDLLERFTRITARPGVLLKDDMKMLGNAQIRMPNYGAPKTLSNDVYATCNPYDLTCQTLLPQKEPAPDGWQVVFPDRQQELLLDSIRSKVRGYTLTPEGKIVGRPNPLPFAKPAEELAPSFNVQDTFDLKYVEKP